MASRYASKYASKYIALIPAYEPDKKMLAVIDDLSRAGFETVVVDDGSGPEYREIFREAGRSATVISYETNMGKGAALKTGLAYIYDYRAGSQNDIQYSYRGRVRHSDHNYKGGEYKAEDFRFTEDEASDIQTEMRTDLISEAPADAPNNIIVVTVDADGQHLIKDVLRVARAAAANPGTLVLGSRGMSRNKKGDLISAADNRAHDRSGANNYASESGTECKNSKIPLRSRFGNTITRHVFRLSTGLPIHDTQTGLRAFSTDMIPTLLEIEGSRYEYEINMLLESAARGIPIREERIDTVYIDNNSSSHFDAVKDSFRVYREILKFSASSLAGFAVDYVMFALLTLLTPSLATANIGARLVSSVTNYTLNRKFVFKSSKKISASAAQYFALAAVILAGNTVVLSTLSESLGINSLAAKIITELIFFIISWTVQRYLIFYRDEAAAAETEEANTKQYALHIKGVRKMMDNKVDNKAAEIKDKKIDRLNSRLNSRQNNRLKNQHKYLAAFMSVLMAFSTYVMMDTFFITRVYSDAQTSLIAGQEQDDAADTDENAAASSGRSGSAGSSGEEEQSIDENGTEDDSEAGNQHSGKGSSGKIGNAPGKMKGGKGGHRHGPGKGSRSGSDSASASGSSSASAGAGSVTSGGSASTSSGSSSADGSGSSTNNSADNSADSSANGNSSASAVSTADSYKDDKMSITLKEYRENDTTIYVADVQLKDASYLKTALAQGSYGRNVTAKTSEIAESVNAVLAVNGDYYGAQESGYVIRNGKLYRNKALKNQEDLVIYKDGSFEIINESNVTAEQLIQKGAVQTLSFGPALVQNGKVSVGENEEVGQAMASNPRTAIGIIDENHYVFVVSDGRTSESSGLSLKELAEFMDGLGVETAYNLDGGGSSTMYFNGKVVNNPTTGGSTTRERSVSDIVYIGK